MVYLLCLILASYAIRIFAIPTPTNTTYQPHPHPIAILDSGIVAGITTSIANSTINKFLGIPFAAPPSRFSPPRPPAPWHDIYNASEYRPACIQQFNFPNPMRDRIIQWYNTPPPPAGESEDCLNLNVFAPASASPASKKLLPRPVLFWIHGGSLRFGSGSLPIYDGSWFAANQDVIVVTSNYRTNVFGFPGTSALPETERNLGWLDQRFALDWVQRNIAAFGGDPARVTIVGESSGGRSVDALITNPPHPAPFHAAIMESGQTTTIAAPIDPDGPWNALVQATNCTSSSPHDTVKCIRSLPALKIKDIIERHAIEFAPVPDGNTTFPNTPRSSRQASTQKKPIIARVPILIGSNADEGSAYALGQNDTAQFLDEQLPTLPKVQIQEIIAAYPLGSPGIRNETERIAKIITDFAFQCPAALVADESANVGIHAWRYFFNASFPNSQLFKGAGAYHASEIGLVFGTYPRKGATAFQTELSNTMQTAWANFAKHPGSGPGWPVVPKVGVFGGGVRPGKSVEGKKPLTTINSEEIDQRCALLQGVYHSESLGE